MSVVRLGLLLCVAFLFAGCSHDAGVPDFQPNPGATPNPHTASRFDPGAPATTPTPVATTPSASAPAVAANPNSKNPLDQMGIPVYPKSKQVKVDIAKPAANGTKRTYVEYSSADSGDKVTQFYQDKLQLMVSDVPGTKLHQLVGKLGNGSFVQILVSGREPTIKIQYYFILPK